MTNRSVFLLAVATAVVIAMVAVGVLAIVGRLGGNSDSPFISTPDPLGGLSAATSGLVPVVATTQVEQAIDFRVTLFNGGSFRLSDQVGKTAVVLNFWYPTCPPCRAQMPAFQRSWQELQGEDVRFLGLFVPQGLDTEQDARDFVDELGLTYDFATTTRAQVVYFPTTVFIDRKGRIFRSEIATLDEEKIMTIVRQMIHGPLTSATSTPLTISPTATPLPSGPEVSVIVISTDLAVGQPGDLRPGGPGGHTGAGSSGPGPSGVFCTGHGSKGLLHR